MLQSDKAWYTQHHSFDAWTYERFDAWLGSTQGKRGFFANHTLPRMKDAILMALKSARSSFSAFPPPRASTQTSAQSRWACDHEHCTRIDWMLWHTLQVALATTCGIPATRLGR